MIETRALGVEDQQQLWRWLHLALWDPPPAELRSLEVLQQEGVRIYAEHWGRAGDVGVVAQYAGEAIGACWMRLLPQGVGLASVDEQTPQLGIALEPEFQHKGYGQPLMQAAIEAAARANHRYVSLTVHPENPAQNLYRRCGFREIGRRNNYRLMLLQVPF